MLRFLQKNKVFMFSSIYYTPLRAHFTNNYVPLQSIFAYNNKNI